MTTGASPLQQAIQWISDRLKENPKSRKSELIDEASQRFSLSPRDGEFLFAKFTRVSQQN